MEDAEGNSPMDGDADQPTATQKFMELLTTSDGRLSPRGVAYLSGHIPISAFIAEIDDALTKARAMATARATAERERGAVLVAQGIGYKGLMVAVADLDPLRQGIERAEALAQRVPITPETKTAAVLVAVNYSVIAQLMAALNFAPVAMQMGLDYARGRVPLSDIAALLVMMADMLERNGHDLSEQGRKEEQADVDALRDALSKVEAQPESERERERILWCEAVDGIKGVMTIATR